MPWLALPFSERDTKSALSKKFKVRGIPSLVFLDRDGNTLVKDGRSAVMKDPEGADFPWKLKSVPELLGDKFVAPDDKIVNGDAIKGKYLGLYFSAHWCPPCRGFTPSFAETYKTMKDRGIDNFEVIFVSSDKDQESFDEYRKEQPWLALPFEARKEKDALSETFEVMGIPTLVILGPDGDRQVINVDGRAAVAGDPSGEKFPWHPPLVPGLEDASRINDAPFVVVYADTVSSEVAGELRKVLEGVAAAAKTAKENLGFAIAEPGDGLVERIRKLTHMESAGVASVYVDVQEDGAFFLGPTEITADSLTQFISDVKSGKSERLQLG
jgi:nucleoredoxin